MVRLEAPSGAVFSAHDLDILRRLNERKSVEYRDRPFRLKSGVDSNVYVRMRSDFTEDPMLQYMVGCKIADTVYKYTQDGRQPILMGIPTAGNALAAAGSIASVFVSEGSMPAIGYRIMREKLKQSHGPDDTWVNGAVNLVSHTYWVVDNVATDGQSKIETAEKLEQDGYPARSLPHYIWIDRQQGAVAKLTQAGFTHLVVGFQLLDITYAFGEMELWPKNAVASVEAEIKAHQFV